ncbi:MAG: cysteine peptidase family C39 domain-containing protein, partial [Candidatus Omnitrophota bacterium]
INPDKLSCSDELKRLQSEGKIGVNTAILLLESGYTLSEIVYAYVDMALDWAGGKTVELVNCAAFALADVLGIPTQKRGDIDLENLAADIIYNDILMQGEVWIKDGKIQSSMAAIQKTASSYGIDLNAYQVDTDAFFASRTKPVIIHLKQGHWVVLKSVYGDKATIISDGKKVQMSLSGLKEMFSGYVLTQENIENAKQLNITDTQQIRGSGWGKKFKKWRSKMSDKLKSFASSSFGKVIMSIAAVALAFATAGTLSPMFSSVFGEIMGAAIADGIGAFTSTFAIGSASGMKTKDALKAAIIAGVTAGVASYAANKASAAKAAKTTQAAETAAQGTAADAVQVTAQKQAAQETVKETVKQVSKDTIKQLTSDTAKKKITAYAIQEALVASGGSNPYTNVIASALTGGANAVIDGKSVVESVVKSAAAQGLNETAGTNEWNSQVRKLANAAVNSAAGSVLDDKDSSWTDGVKDAFKATVDDVKNNIKEKIDTIKKGAEKVYEVNNQGMEFFKEAGKKVNDAKNSWLDTAKNGIESFISEAGDKIKQAKPGDLLKGPMLDKATKAFSPMGQNITGQILEGFASNTPETRVDYDKDSNTVNIDQYLNYLNQSPDSALVTGIDFATILTYAKKRWGPAQKSAAIKYEEYVKLGVKGIALSGVSDDGNTLHKLVQEIAKGVGDDISFTITHSAGAGVLMNANITTDKVILISPQVSREELEAWIDARGLKKEDVLVVDVKGDLPYAPGVADYIGAGVKNRGDLAGVISDILSNNAYNDYSSNPNGKYTYVRIEEGG